MLRITILCDNIVGYPFGIGEHGFAAYIERDAEVLLFDTGSGRALVPNSLTFGCDLKKVRKVCLSHGHFDHTEGLAQFLQLTNGADVYGHPGIFQERYGERRLGEKTLRRFIGIPHRREYLEQLGARFDLECEFREIAQGIYLTGEVPRETSFEKGDQNLLIPFGGSFAVDPVLDDQSLVISTPAGLIVIMGCAHSGMINTLRYASRKMGDKNIRAVLGGTHLGFLSSEQQEQSIEELVKLEPQLVAVSHCTGLEAGAKLSQALKERFTFGHVGKSFLFD